MIYDPIGVIHQDDRAAHGMKVVSAVEDLRKWISGVLFEEECEL